MIVTLNNNWQDYYSKKGLKAMTKMILAGTFLREALSGAMVYDIPNHPSTFDKRRKHVVKR